MNKEAIVGNKDNKNRRVLGKSEGFTLIEMLVSVFILVLATTAPVYIAAKAINLASQAKNKVVAVYLANESLEYLKNKRDENVLKILAGDLSVTSAFYGVTDGVVAGTTCIDSDKVCRIDPVNIFGSFGKIYECPAASVATDPCALVRYRTSGLRRLYGHNVWYFTNGTTQFRRWVDMDYNPGSTPHELKLTVHVTWSGGEIVAETYLYSLGFHLP